MPIRQLMKWLWETELIPAILNSIILPNKVKELIGWIHLKSKNFKQVPFFVEILLCRSGPDIDIGGGCCFSRWLCWLRHFPIICCSYKHLKSFYCLYNAMSIISMILCFIYAFSIFDFLSYFFVALWFVLVGSRMALQGNGYFLSEPLSSVSQPLPLDQCYNQQPGQQ